MDEELQVDLIVSKNENPIGGLQVNPLTFNIMRKGVIAFNKVANAKWGKPVFYLFYDENERFVNTEAVVDGVLKCC